MSLARVSLPLLFACLTLTACSNRDAIPSSPDSPSIFSAAKKSFGVGLSTSATLFYGGTYHEHDYCQVPKDPYDNCPAYADGKKSIVHSGKGSASDPSFGAKLSYDQSGRSSLGFDQFSQKVSVSSKHPTLDSSAGQQHFLWQDVLHVNSNSHPALTPVKIWFQLAVNPSKTKVNCKYDPTAWLDFSATGDDKNQSTLEVTGKCTNGKFTYTLDDGRGAKGLKDVGYENTNVSYNLNLFGAGNVRLHACQLVVSCAKAYSSELAGTVTWRVTKISPSGVTVSSDSGTRYGK